MKYMFLLCSAPDAGPAPGSPEQAAEHEAWFAYTAAMAEAGCLVAGDALHADDTATTVRVRSGEVMSTDGPFAETKEVLSGYYVIDVADLDEATRWAARCPLAPYGSVEIRPIMVFEDMPGS